MASPLFTDERAWTVVADEDDIQSLPDRLRLHVQSGSAHEPDLAGNIYTHLFLNGREPLRHYYLVSLMEALLRHQDRHISLVINSPVWLGACSPLAILLADPGCCLRSFGLVCPRPFPRVSKTVPSKGPWSIAEMVCCSDMKQLSAGISANRSLEEISIVGYILTAPAICNMLAAATRFGRLRSLELGELSLPCMRALTDYLSQPDHRCPLTGLFLTHPHAMSRDLLDLVGSIISHNVSLTSVRILIDTDTLDSDLNLAKEFSQALDDLETVLAQNRLFGRRCLAQAGRVLIGPHGRPELSLPTELTDLIVGWTGLSGPEWRILVFQICEMGPTHTAAHMRRKLAVGP